MKRCKKIMSIVLSAIMILSCLSYVTPLNAADGVTVARAGGWNETLYIELSGVTDSDVTAVSYSGPTSGSLTGEDFKYLVRDYNGGVRVDVLGLKPGAYSVEVTTSKGTVTESNIVVEEQDRSGYAHFNYTDGVGAYNDDGTLKDNAVIVYVTNENKNTVSVTSKDGTTVAGIGHILNSAGKDTGSGTSSKGGTCNNNNDIIRRLADDGTPLVVRIIGDVKAPEGLTAYDSINNGGTVGDNGFMARMQSGKDITIEGVGAGAKINGWGIHFICTESHPKYGKSFEMRNINFYNVPEDCVGMEGQQSGTVITAGVERCWVHHCSFFAPVISNPAESDKGGGDGACDFKRGQYFTNSYCYYDGYHKTNLVGAGDSVLQYNITFHHNYWKNCESRVPLARNANIHMYNNLVDGQTSYIMSLRADCFIFSEYNCYINSKDVTDGRTGGVCKSFNDTVTNCRGKDTRTVVTDRSTTLSSNNKYPNFDTNSALSYIPSGDYKLNTDKTTIADSVKATAGAIAGTGTSDGSGSGEGGGDEDETGGSGGEVIVPSADSFVHIIQEDGVASEFYTFSTNAYSESKGSVVLNGTTYSKCLKMQSATTITFNAPSAGKLILGFCSGCASKTVDVDGSVYSLASSQVLTVDVSSGTHTVKKKSGESYLYYIIYEPESSEEETQPHEHSYTSEVTKEPTCTEAGVMTYTCECGDSYTETIEATGHSHTKVVTKEPTCTEGGVATYTCECGDSYTEAIEATGHSHTKVVTKEPTCTEGGVATYTCECGDAYTEDLDALGHSYGGFVIDKHATYTEEGEQSRYCSHCNDRIDVTVIPVMEALPSGIYGDVNADGEVGLADAVMLKQHLASMTVELNEAASDVNADGVVDLKDAVKLMKSLAGMDVVLGEAA
ncbi:MAG: hypothetical protein IJB96_04310 [Lachnospira sp.]|nr:hypothetical protein [Lachnospira sp.]